MVLSLSGRITPACNIVKHPRLLRKIEELQGTTPWGRVLDAGTGPASLPWVASLPTEHWTAVSAQPGMLESARESLPARPRETDRLIQGNWADPSLLEGEHFDTVILDHFIGAVDAFAPYYQETLLHRLASHARGVMYVTGIEPYVPDIVEQAVGSFVGDLGRLRDACMLLARERPYREYPAEWVAMHLQGVGFKVTDTTYLPMRYRDHFLSSQLGICEARVERFGDPDLAAAMSRRIAAMRARGEALIAEHDGLTYGRHYVIAAQATA